MKIEYNVTGNERKLLVKAISNLLDAPSKYLGMPSAAYEVGGYHIDKTGTLTGADNRDLVADLCGCHSFKAVSEEYDEPVQDNRDRVSIVMPMDGFTPDKLDNLFKLVKAKELLIKTAIGADELPIVQRDDKLLFPWFYVGTDEGDTADAHATLVSLLCKTAKEKKRITAKEKNIEGSPKYAMRCFLLSLGFIGDEYKAARKTLLANFEGNSSWKNREATA